MRRWLGHVALAGVCLSTGLTACHHHPAARPAPPAAVVQGDFDAISVTAAASHQTAAVPAGLQKGLKPLLIARTVDQQGPLSDYGLDDPPASLTYRDGASPVVVR